MEIIDHSMSKRTLKFLKKFPGGPRNLQIYAKKHRRNSVVIVASTGLGKTEASFVWGGEEKLCYFLPLRVATNAIFDRAVSSTGINYQHAGLLHSSSVEHLDESGLVNVFNRHQNSRQLIDPVVFSTIDQLFIYPFCYGGYEKVLATLSYSKVIIDEIQSYDPKIAAVVLYGLKKLQFMGGRFMLMTATLPKFYLDMLKKWGIKFDYKEFLSPLKRHKLQMYPRDIICDVNDIASDGKKKKVLVIVNTIAKANAICKELKAYGCNAKLFHALFNGEDRRRLEMEVASFSNNETENGVWVTTQIVEASLDIDFDVLYTEFSSPDSLFQRMGRVYRDRPYNKIGPNVKVYTEICSGIETIYDKSIFNLSKDAMLDFVEKPKYITEQRKQDIVNKIYSEKMLKGTTYYKTFNEALDFLQKLAPYSVTKSEAQDLFRNINSYQTIPEVTFQKFEEKIAEAIETLSNGKANKDEKMYARRYLSDKSVNVPAYRINKNKVIIKAIKGTDDNIYRINCKYNENRGLLLNELYCVNLV
jgi:CRISPR-associated endonuclease/helicase Cas3